MTGKEGPSNLKTWLIVLISLLDDVALLALIFLGLWFFHVKITWVVILVVGLVIVAFFLIMHRAIVPSLSRRKVTGTEGMIGMVGEVTEKLMPKGRIKVNSEYWKARSLGGNIRVGEEVEIVAVNGLTLEVKQRET